VELAGPLYEKANGDEVTALFLKAADAQHKKDFRSSVHRRASQGSKGERAREKRRRAMGRS